MTLTSSFDVAGQGSGNDITIFDAGVANMWDGVTKTLTGNVTFSNVHVARGAFACFVDVGSNSTSSCLVRWNTTLGTLTDHYGRLYLYLPALPASGYVPVVFYYSGLTFEA